MLITKLLKAFTIMSLIFLNFSCSTNSAKMKQGKRFSSLVVFGDGLNDMGAWGKITNFKYPPAEFGFLDSRWTNGKVWVEILADRLNLDISLKNNFAMGGATTGLYNINEPLRQKLNLPEDVKLMGMLAQVKQYLSNKPSIEAGTLFVLWAGGHDIGNYLEYGQPDLAKYPPAENIKICIDLLVRSGAKNILIATVPDLGFAPGIFGTPKQSVASKLSADINNGIDSIIKKFSENGIHFYKFEGGKVFAHIASSSAKFGIKYLDSYLPVGAIDFSNPLKTPKIKNHNKEKNLDPNEFMNWWSISPSSKVHQVLAEEALSLLDIKNKLK